MSRSLYQLLCTFFVACSLMFQGVAGAAMVGCHETSSPQMQGVAGAAMVGCHETSSPQMPMEHQVSHNEGHASEHSHHQLGQDSHSPAHAKVAKDKADDCCDCHAVCKVSIAIPDSSFLSDEPTSQEILTPSLVHPNPEITPPFRPPISI